MKKNYFLLLICLLLSTVAGAESITDVYGTYTFTATMNVTSEGKDLASKLSDNCEVTISKDASNIYLAYIDGIAGSTKGGHAVSNYTNGQLVIKNMNDYNTGNFDGGLFFSTVDGLNPFGMTMIPDWILTVNSEDGSISIPDFSIITINSYEDSLGTIIATFTDAKLTLKEKTQTDVPNITGNYTYTHGQGTYDCKSDATFSADYTMTLTASDDTNKNYKVEYIFDNQYYVALTGTFDGVSLEVPFENEYLDDAKTIRMGTINGTASGTVTYSYVKAGILSAYNGLSIMQDSISAEQPGGTLQWFINGNAKDQSQIKDDDVDFCGTYTVVAKYLDMAGDYSSKDDTFTIEIAKDDYGYYVPKICGYDPIYGGLSAKVDADDPSKLLITPSYLEFISTDEEIESGVYKYIVMTDMNGQFSDIALTANADGTYSLDQFATAYQTYGESTVSFIRYYQDIISVTKDAAPEPAQVTIPGTYKYTGRYCTMDNTEGTEVSFDIKIEENEYYDLYGGSKYLMTYFDGDGIYNLNYGGASLYIADETTFPVKMELYGGTLIDTADDCDYEAGVYTYKALYDINGDKEANALTITLNADGTCEITDFSVYKETFSMETYGYEMGDLIGWYTNGKLTDGIQQIENGKLKVDNSIYNLAGQRVSKAQKGVYVINGKKVLK